MKLPTPPPCPICGSKTRFVGKPDKKGVIEMHCESKEICGVEGLYQLDLEPE